MSVPSMAGFLASLALIASAFGISLFFDGYYSILYVPVAAALLLLSCMNVMPAALRGTVRWPFSGTSILLFAFWLFITVSLSWSSVPFSSLLTYLVFITLPLAFFGTLTGNKDPRSTLHAAFLFLTAALCGLAVMAGIQHFFIGGDYASRAHLMFADPNNLAALLNLGLLPMLATLLTTPSGTRKFYGSALASALLFLGLAATESRGGMLCLLIAFAVMLFLLRPQGKRAALIVAGGMALFLLSGLGDGMRHAGKLIALVDFTSDSSSLARLAIWQSTLNYIRDHELLGTGFGTYYLYAPSYRLPGPDDSGGQWAHMDPLQLWAELGILGPILFYAIAIAICLRTFAALKDSHADRAAIAGMFCAMLALFLHAHTTFQFYVMPILLILGLWLARWHVLTADSLASTSFRSVLLIGWQKPFLAVIAVSVALLLGLMVASSAVGIHYLQSAKDDIARADMEGFVAKLNKADRFGPASFVDPQVHMAGLYIDLLRHPLANHTPQEKQETYAQGMTNLEFAQKMNPAWWEIDHLRAQLNILVGEDIVTGSTDNAIAAWREAIRKYPMHYRARSFLIAALVNQGRAVEAFDVIKTVKNYPMPPEEKVQFDIMYESLARVAEAAAAYEAAKKKKAEAAQ